MMEYGIKVGGCVLSEPRFDNVEDAKKELDDMAEHDKIVSEMFIGNKFTKVKRSLVCREVGPWRKVKEEYK